MIRRAFLKWIFWALPGALALRFAGVSPSATGLDFPWSGAGARAAARRVGRAYLRRHPAEADVALLRAALAADLGDPERLRARVRGDFEREAVVRVQGWVLSRTEARLCALEALG